MVGLSRQGGCSRGQPTGVTFFSFFSQGRTTAMWSWRLGVGVAGLVLQLKFSLMHSEKQGVGQCFVLCMQTPVGQPDFLGEDNDLHSERMRFPL